MPIDFPIELLHHAVLNGLITVRSGLHIGASKDSIEIGGIDAPVIRELLTGDPYIPGSSLKGKLRNLLEQKYPQQRQNVRTPCDCRRDTCPVCRLFGPHSNLAHQLGPSRLLVRDAYLTLATSERLAELRTEGSPTLEVKQETLIDRQTGTASGTRSLRSQERVPPSIEFDLSISMRVFKGDNEADMKRWVEEALGLLENDALGGSGSRGYGWVKIAYSWAS
ncbi:MAG: type III-A CRISPR-associated RAMP protein Csm3 [Chloroflexi bacterium]|nr:type III-A CRISPR-associated RAMP protein Csm3 [Chloroflexota bacterium]